jgi:hypothetical protein
MTPEDGAEIVSGRISARLSRLFYVCRVAPLPAGTFSRKAARNAGKAHATQTKRPASSGNADALRANVPAYCATLRASCAKVPWCGVNGGGHCVDLPL